MADVTINTIQDLVAFSNGDYGRGTSSAYLDVVLTADIDFNDLNEYNSPYNWAGCTGTWYVNFDGQGHKVDNIYYMGTSTWGFFGTLYGSVRNLKLTNMYVTTTNAMIGGVVLYSGGAKITNCHVAGHLESIGTPYCSGICAASVASGSEVGFCSVSGLVKSTSDALGLVGNHSGYGMLLYSSIIVADVQANNLAPLCSAGTTVINCEFRGTLKGGTLYYGYNATLKNCIFVIKSDSSFSSVRTSTINNCYYDNTEWTGTLSQLTPATTTELQDSTWLKEHGFAI